MLQGVILDELEMKNWSVQLAQMAAAFIMPQNPAAMGGYLFGMQNPQPVPFMPMGGMGGGGYPQMAYPQNPYGAPPQAQQGQPAIGQGLPEGHRVITDQQIQALRDQTVAAIRYGADQGYAAGQAAAGAGGRDGEYLDATQQRPAALHPPGAIRDTPAASGSAPNSVPTQTPLPGVGPMGVTPQPQTARDGSSYGPSATIS